jgi:hypothetical protein
VSGCASKPVKTASRSRIIEIIKLSAEREPRGYDGTPIFKKNIKFYVNDMQVNDFNLFPSRFKSMKIVLSDDEKRKIHNFIGYISENASTYQNMNFNLIHVYNYLGYMDESDEQIKYADISMIIELIKLSAGRQQQKYSITPIIKYNIELYVDGKKVKDLGNFSGLFESDRIFLSVEEINRIDNFIGYLSENASTYKNLKFNLKDVHSSLDYIE